MGHFQSERRSQARVNSDKANSQVTMLHDPDRLNQTGSVTDSSDLTSTPFLTGPPLQSACFKYQILTPPFP